MFCDIRRSLLNPPNLHTFNLLLLWRGRQTYLLLVQHYVLSFVLVKERVLPSSTYRIFILIWLYVFKSHDLLCSWCHRAGYLICIALCALIRNLSSMIHYLLFINLLQIRNTLRMHMLMPFNDVFFVVHQVNGPRNYPNCIAFSLLIYVLLWTCINLFLLVIFLTLITRIILIILNKITAAIVSFAICQSLFIYLLLLMLWRFTLVIRKNNRLRLLNSLSWVQFNLASVILPQIKFLFAFTFRVVCLSSRVVILLEKEIFRTLPINLFKFVLKFPCWWSLSRALITSVTKVSGIFFDKRKLITDLMGGK